MSRNKSFPIGDTVRLVIYFRVDDVLTDPATVVVTIEEPDGTDNAPSVTNVSTGIRSVQFTTDQSGYHRWKVVATGDAAGVREGAFYVHTSGIVADA